MTPRSLASLAVLVSVLLSRSVDARPEAETLAYAAYKEATRLFRAGDYRSAAKKFEEACSHWEHPNAIYFLAEAHRRLGEMRRSHAVYARYAATLSEAERTAFTPKLEALRWQAEVLLAIATLPGGAAVRVDGIPRGTTPRDGSALTLAVGGGIRTIEIVLDGHLPVRSRLEAEFGEPRALSFALKPIPAPASARAATLAVDPDRARPASTPLPRIATPQRTDTTARRAWLLSSGGAALLAAVSLGVGIAYNVKHNDTYEGSAALDGYRAASTTGYALAGSLATGAAIGFITYWLKYRSGR